ncbi:primosomal protein N' [uncultured Corynebacterium sp.]|uniref:primosomal protein N' n=1 Tax=uncultured Corynebacterium sp. TaxID=159447 RepID=UPI0025EF7A08|nr:primosomal protein N' [uncultured Corynebacterium sp.]
MSISPHTPAPDRPVARVLPLLKVAHLDREFDYLVDATVDEDVKPGVMVRVHFSGRLTDALVLSREDDSDHAGRLSWIDRVISREVVAPETFRTLVYTLAQRYGGLRSDIIRSALPPRHATAEKVALEAIQHGDDPWASAADTENGDTDNNDSADNDAADNTVLGESWSRYRFGPSFVNAVLHGEAPRAVWQIAPGDEWPMHLAQLAAQTARGGDGVLIIVPDQRTINRLSHALKEVLSSRQWTQLTASLGRHARYRRYIDILHGVNRVVVGTRGAAFVPVKNLSLIVILDDGNDNLVDPRAPYVHAREVLTLRATIEKAAMIVGGVGRTAEAQLLVESGWAHNLMSSRETIRAAMPWIRAIGDTDFELAKDPVAKRARIPHIAFEAIRSSHRRGRSALIHVRRKGYVPTLACQRCGEPARCRYCNGPLGLPGQAAQEIATSHICEQASDAGYPTCRWCGRPDPSFRCDNCGSTRIRAVVVGADRTAEELGRSFPGIPVVVSTGDNIVASIPDEPSLVIATPGSAPVAEDKKFGAAVILDTWSELRREDVRAHEEALISWFDVASLVESHNDGGEVVVVADAQTPVVQSLIRWDPVGAASVELEHRREAGFSPAVHMAAIDGTEHDISQFRRLIDVPPDSQFLGPVPLPPGIDPPANTPLQDCLRLLIRVNTSHGPLALGSSLRAARIKAAVNKVDLAIRVIVDPIHIG